MNRRQTAIPDAQPDPRNRGEELLLEVTGASRLPLIMGVLNVTPDSFYDGGKWNGTADAVKRGIDMAASGAHIIDIGGESTRPGSEPVPLEEERNRVIPVVLSLRKELPSHVLISVDTYKSPVAAAALDAGACMINDISFGTFDREIVGVAAARGAWFVGMHIQGTPRDMQRQPSYGDVVGEVRAWLTERAQQVNKAGIAADRILIDPGIGFGKNDDHNLALLRSVPVFRETGFPVLIGASRKSLMGRLLGLEPEQRLAPSLAIALKVATLGAAVVRVHDVGETRAALAMWRYL